MAAHSDVAPLRLAFSADASLPLRDVVAALRDLEIIYWIAVEPEDVGDDPGRYWYARYVQSGRSAIHPAAPVLRRLEYGSPLDLILEVPWEVWLGAGSFIAGGIATVFGLPAKAMQAAADYQAARHQFWDNRLAASKGKQNYIDWAREQNQQRGIQLERAEAPDDRRLPPPGS